MSINSTISVQIPACDEPQKYIEHGLQASPRTYVCHQTVHLVPTYHRCQWDEELGVPLQLMFETKPPADHTPTSGGMTLAPAMKCLILYCSSIFISTSDYKA
jgi:hypothetical protein